MAVGTGATRGVLVLFRRARRGVALIAPAIVSHIGTTAEFFLVFLEHVLCLHDVAVQVGIRTALVFVTESLHRLLKLLNV